MIEPSWRSWVGSCVKLGAWLVGMSLFWLVLFVRAVLRGDAGGSGSGPLALAAVLAFLDIAVLGNLGRFWLKPRWPGPGPTTTWRRAIDPAGRVLPLVTAVVLVANLLLGISGEMDALDWVSVAMSALGLLLLGPVVVRVPAGARQA